MTLTSEQLAVINLEAAPRIYLSGIAGSGKTTVLEERFSSLLEAGETADSILVLVADSAHRERFQTIADHSTQPDRKSVV